MDPRNYRHGHNRVGHRSRTYSAWANMMHRGKHGEPCYAVRPMVCERWEMFANFLADMGEAPPGYTIERVNNLGDYEPSNCVWATRQQQNRNRTSTKMTEETVKELRALRQAGVSYKELGEKFGIARQHASRLCCGKKWPEEEPPGAP